jgi:hypothetical protein
VTPAHQRGNFLTPVIQQEFLDPSPATVQVTSAPQQENHPIAHDEYYSDLVCNYKQAIDENEALRIELINKLKKS